MLLGLVCVNVLTNWGELADIGEDDVDDDPDETGELEVDEVLEKAEAKGFLEV